MFTEYFFNACPSLANKMFAFLVYSKIGIHTVLKHMALYYLFTVVPVNTTYHACYNSLRRHLLL